MKLGGARLRDHAGSAEHRAASVLGEADAGEAAVVVGLAL
jgi:hypothetical protein